MSDKYVTIPEITADPFIVTAFTNHLLEAFDEFIATFDGRLDYSDGLMAAHNFHKAIVLDLVDRTDAPEWIVVAKATFDQSMEKAQKDAEKK